MKYYFAITHDGRSYRFDENGLKAVEEAMRTKQVVRLEGLLVAGSSISRIDFADTADEVNETSRRSIDELAKLPPPADDRTGIYPVGFWRMCVHLNMIRLRNKLKPITNADIDVAFAEGLSDPIVIFQRIDPGYAFASKVRSDREWPDHELVKVFD